MVPPKRKRSDRPSPPYESRPSPHRPDSLGMAHSNSRHDSFESGRGGGPRRGRGGYSRQPPHDQRQPRQSLNNEPQSSPSSSTPAPGSLVVRASRPPPPTPTATPTKPPPPRAVVVVREPSPPPDGQSDNHVYQYITDELVAQWAEKGREQCKASMAAEEDLMTLGLWFQELARSAMQRRIAPEDVGALYSEVEELTRESVKTESDLDLHQLLVDTVALLPATEWRRLSLTQFVSATNIPMDIWRLNLDTETVEALGMARERFTRKKAGKITNHLYRQSNYNLLREESEGYAKLITEYFDTAQNTSATVLSATIAVDAFDRVKALIGTFDLDVGRVLDITLDVFADMLVRNFRFFVKFIRASSWWPQLECPDIVKWKDQGFDSLPAWALPESKSWGIGPDELSRLAALRSLQESRDTAFWAQLKDLGMNAFSGLGSKQILNFDDEDVQKLLNSELEANKDDVDARGTEKNRIKRMRINEAREWMLQTKTLPPQGNADAASLLGFKLSFYGSPARDAEDVMPENIIYLAALLIKIGFISLRDLYPHLLPADEAMDKVKMKLEKEQEDRDRNRSGGVLSKLAMSGALADDTLPTMPAIRSLKDAGASKVSTPKPGSSPKPAEAAPEVLPETPDQKTALLKSLLAIGAIPEALFMIGRFPWVLELDPDLPQYIHRILHHMLSKVYAPIRPLEGRPGLAEPHDLLGSPGEPPKGTLNRVKGPERPAKRWAKLDKADQGEGQAFKYYWDDWSDNVPVCQTIDDVFLMCSTFLNLSGVKIGQDPALLLTLVRIGKHSLKQDKSTENRDRWTDLLKRLIVPALSLTTKNPGAANEVFELLSLFPTSVRYSIYAEWHHGTVARLPEIKRAFKATRREASDVLKRISKTNVRQMGKALAKASYSSPGIVLQTAINQMESYENLIEVFVECSRYFTFLGYDVLTWCLLNALGGNSDRPKVQADGMLTSPWLRALSTFAGALYKRYTHCDPIPILQYLAHELGKGDTTNLELLEQMVTAMTGIKSDIIFNDNQVLAMAGGDVLRAQTLKQMADERHVNQKTSKRLMKALADSDLVGRLLVSIAQERQMYMFRPAAENAPLKVVASNVDKIHTIFVQYLEALRANLDVQEFAAAIPGPVRLMRDFGLDVEIAFMIGRPGVTQEINRIDALKKAELQARLKAHGEPVVKVTKDESAAKIESSTAPEPLSQPGAPADADVKMEDVDSKEIAEAASKIEAEAWHPALSPIINEIATALPDDISPALSKPFYVTFWTLDLQDIVISTASYEQEISRQTALFNQIKNDRSDSSAANVKEREIKMKAITELKAKIASEMRAQIGAHTAIRSRLSNEKDHWFPKASHKELNTALLENCFVPRITLSSLDAYFTFTMIKYLHANGARYFYTMHLYDMLLDKRRLSNLLFGFTAREAENFGRFLNELLKELATWHADKATYERHAIGGKNVLAGFAKSFDDDRVPTAHLGFEEFRTLLFKWHNCISQALQTCFDSGEYMQIRNAIVALKAFHTQFPRTAVTGTSMLSHLQRLSATEVRGDLKLAATSLLGNLKPLEKNWVLPLEFHKVTIKDMLPAMIETILTSRQPRNAKGSDTPASSSNGQTPSKSLNAEASEFRPTTAAQGATPKATQMAKELQEAEDGEIKEDQKEGSTSAKGEEGGELKRTNAVALQGAASGKPKGDYIAPDATSTANTRGPESSSTPALTTKPQVTAPDRPAPRSDATQGSRPVLESRTASRNSSRDPPRHEVERQTRAHARQDYDQHSRPGRSDTDSSHARGSSSQYRRADDYDQPRQDSRPSHREARNGLASSMPLPATNRQSVNQASGPSASTPSKGQASSAATTTSINPARRALIDESPAPHNGRHGGLPERREASYEGPRQYDSPGPPSRSMQPSHNDRAPVRPGTNGTGYSGSDRDHDRDRDRTPAGPRYDVARNDRGFLHDAPPRRDSSDGFGGHGSRGQQDPNYGRLSRQPSARESDPSYGRLDAPEPPSGPKASAPNSRSRPTGPQSQSQGSFGPTSQQTAAGPAKPASRGAPPPVTSNVAAPARSEAQAPAIHPSRLARLDVSDAPKGDASPAAAGRTQTPTGPSPSSAKAPPNGRASGPTNDRRFSSLNDSLQGTPAQGTSIRGRASRSASDMHPATPTAAAPNANAPQRMPPPQLGARVQETTRGMAGRGSAPSTPLPSTPSSAHDYGRPDFSTSRDRPISHDGPGGRDRPTSRDGPGGREGRVTPSGGPGSREPSRSFGAPPDDHRRAPPAGADDRARPATARDDYREYGNGPPRGEYSNAPPPRGDYGVAPHTRADYVGAPQRGGYGGAPQRGGYGGAPRDDYGIEDPYARNAAPSRPAGGPGYGQDSRGGYPSQADPYAGGRGSGHNAAYVNSRGGYYGGAEGRGAYGGARPGPRDNRGGGWEDYRDDADRKRHGDEMGRDPSKRGRG